MFPTTVLLEIERLPTIKMPPPSADVEAHGLVVAMVQLASVIAPSMFCQPAADAGELPLIVQLVSLVVAYSAAFQPAADAIAGNPAG